MARASTSRCSAARGGPGDARCVFDCDGVLADTERYGHLPAFNATFAEFGLPVQWTEDEYAREAEDRRRQGADGQPVRRPGVRRGRPACRPTTRAARSCSPGGTGPRPRTSSELVAAGGIPPRPGIARIITSRAGRRLDGRGRLDLGRGVGARRAGARRRDETAARGPGLRRRRRAGQEAGPGDLPARRRAARARPRPTRWSSRTPATACSPRPAAGLPLPGHGQRLHPGRGLRRGRAGGVRARRPRPAADRGARRPRRGRPGDYITLDDLRACLGARPARPARGPDRRRTA